MAEVYGLPDESAVIEVEVMEPPRMLSADAILNVADVREAIFSVPEWGGAVRIKGFTKGQQQVFKRQATIKGTIDEDRLEMLMLINGIVEPKFSTDQIELLRGKSFGVIERILTEILKISGLTANTIKEAEKNFRS